MTAPTSLADAVAEAAAGMTRDLIDVVVSMGRLEGVRYDWENQYDTLRPLTDADATALLFFRNHADEIARRLREGEAALALVRRLAVWIDSDTPCWCDDMPDTNLGEPHTSLCEAARALLSGADQ